uniref:Predicted protein n=1 Tax=Hordeum vulgare subsp. vulgare TaxID=112509 RepID=F2E572_HORVV|nr:predicted protein [Hordeum vulgare subsp. vulgare]
MNASQLIPFYPNLTMLLNRTTPFPNHQNLNHTLPSILQDEPAEWQSPSHPASFQDRLSQEVE